MPELYVSTVYTSSAKRKDQILCVQEGVNWDRCEGHLGGHFVEPNLEAQECVPLSKLRGAEEVIKGKGGNK